MQTSYRPRRTTQILAAAGTFALVLAGCGDDGAEEPADEPMEDEAEPSDEATEEEAEPSDEATEEEG